MWKRGGDPPEGRPLRSSDVPTQRRHDLCIYHGRRADMEKFAKDGYLEKVAFLQRTDARQVAAME